MKSTEGSLGRIFVLRLEDGDVLPDCIEAFAAEKEIQVASVSLVGGINQGEVVSGPEDADARPLTPMHIPVVDAHEVSATGVIAPDTEGKPILHIHGALGREGKTLTGCLRPGVTTWLVGEAVVCEIVGADAARIKDETSGLPLLQVGKLADRLKETAAVPAPQAPAEAATSAPMLPEPALYILNAEFQ